MGQAAQMVADIVKSPIEIRNLYYLFLYAWGYFDGVEATDVELSEETDLVNLFAKVLRNGTRRLLRRGLDRGYQEFVEETAAPRGRFLLGETVKRASITRGAAVCNFDELSPDLLHNQIIKATLKRLFESADLDSAIAHDLRLLQRQLAGVDDIRLSDHIFGRVQLTRNSKHYGLLIKICELLHRHLLAGEGGIKGSFSRLLKDEDMMHSVFEEFVRNFYRTEQSRFSVSRPQVAWDLAETSPLHDPFLPSMQTDITLQSVDCTIIIDTKFYGQILIGRGSPKVRSSHLYQIMTYLTQWRAQNQQAPQPSGLLLYARTQEQDLDVRYVISGFELRVKTLDLRKPWQEVHASLIELLGFRSETNRNFAIA